MPPKKGSSETLIVSPGTIVEVTKHNGHKVTQPWTGKVVEVNSQGYGNASVYIRGLTPKDSHSIGVGKLTIRKKLVLTGKIVEGDRNNLVAKIPNIDYDWTSGGQANTALSSYRQINLRDPKEE